MYAQIIILDGNNKNIDQEYAYCIPKDFLEKIKIGMKVIISFGYKKKLCQGIITKLTNEINIDLDKIKPIIDIDKQNIIIDSKHIELARWMSERYFCTFGSCLKLMFPNKKSVTRDLLINNSYDKNMTNNISVKDLTADQKNAIDFIKNKIYNNDQKPILLHGITGSGKTEVYFNILEKIIYDNKQAIVLLPEISLTTQMINLFFNRFKDKVGITHSKLTPRERFINWHLAKENKISIMIGARSAVFTPFDNLGLIIIDEEHEASYQSETTPKYKTYEVAKKICELYKANLILGSATPSVETYCQAENKKINLITMNTRVNNNNMPEVKIIDMRKEFINGNTSIFSKELFISMKKVLSRGEQVILFLNRRGHSTFVSCRKCGFVLKCSQCDVNYTFHSIENSLLCHYCGEKKIMPKVCPSCGSKYIKSLGLGTEKIESETKKFFSDKKILRMDSDIIIKKSDYEHAIKSFYYKKADILIGTQMIAKGLDFPSVSLVGVMCADISLNNNNFRSGEVTFDLISQVSGRAGRAKTNGLAIIQTYNPEHYSLICARDNNYKSFYKQEIIFRKAMNYPPFSNIFCVLLSSPDENLLSKKIMLLKKIMLKCNKNNEFEIFGPIPAVISKLKNNYRKKILVRHGDYNKLKSFVLFCIDYMYSKKFFSDIKINLAMNPIFML